MHGDDDQIVPCKDASLLSVKLLSKGTLKIYPGFRAACSRLMPRRSSGISSPSSGLEGVRRLLYRLGADRQ
jgi:hypothetical protein